MLSLLCRGCGSEFCYGVWSGHCLFVYAVSGRLGQTQEAGLESNYVSNKQQHHSISHVCLFLWSDALEALWGQTSSCSYLFFPSVCHIVGVQWMFVESKEQIKERPGNLREGFLKERDST